MTTRPEPYLRRDPGDVIRSGDWNEIQIQAREETRGHRHTGAGDGLKIPRAGIEPGAVDGSLIDPAAEATLKKLTLGELAVSGNVALGDIADLHGEIRNLESEKVNRSGDTISGPLNISSELTVNGKLQANSDLHVSGNLEVNGVMIRRIAIATGLGPEDGTDNGQIMSRVLDFTKNYDDTAIRILYCDNLRVDTSGQGARWSIRFNGKEPPGGAICQDKYFSGSALNQLEPGVISGYAPGLPAGQHQIQIWVGPVPGYSSSDIYTGWRSSRWTIEAEEVRI